MYVSGGDLHLLGCNFSENSDVTDGEDLRNFESTVNIDGCPAGFSGAAGAALDITKNGGTINGEAKSYSCVACVK